MSLLCMDGMKAIRPHIFFFSSSFFFFFKASAYSFCNFPTTKVKEQSTIEDCAFVNGLRKWLPIFFSPFFPFFFLFVCLEYQYLMFSLSWIKAQMKCTYYVLTHLNFFEGTLGLIVLVVTRVL